jgi:uncharacterized phage protein (TIGR01671 family)
MSNTQDRFKFRAWLKSENRMGRVKNIDFWESERIISENSDIETHSEYEGLVICGGLSEVEFMQCAGFRDKSGKLAFEGDIIKYIKKNKYERVAKIFWSKEEARFKFYEIAEEREIQINFCHQSGIEIIGNIHQNKELLEE